jgi:hypothetical protein
MYQCLNFTAKMFIKGDTHTRKSAYFANLYFIVAINCNLKMLTSLSKQICAYIIKYNKPSNINLSILLVIFVRSIILTFIIPVIELHAASRLCLYGCGLHIEINFHVSKCTPLIQVDPQIFDTAT